MKTIIAITLTLLTTAAHAQSRTYRDAQGHYSGSSVTHGSSTTYYDRNGHYSGSSTGGR